MKHRVKIFPLALGIASVLSLLLLVFPLSTQTSSFSLSLDLDNSEGDQAVSSLDVFPNRTVPIQIFGTDIASASDLSLRFEFDPLRLLTKDSSGQISYLAPLPLRVRTLQISG